MSAETPRFRRERAIAIGAITLWALVSCFNRLGDPPVYITNEAREGVYVRAMLVTGNFVAPVIANHLENGEVIPDKPPLFHWIAAAGAWARAFVVDGRALDGPSLAQRFDEWTLRFPSAFSAVVMVLAVAALGPALVGERAALVAAAALLTSFQFSYQARLGRVDMTFACCVTLAVLLAGRAIAGGRPRALVLGGAAAGLAVLAKGPLGAILPGLACGAFLLGRRGEGASELPWRAAIATFLAVALPWYVAANWSTGGAILRSQLIAENLDQFIGGNGRMRALLYLQPWLLDSLPWNLVALAALVEVWRRRDAGATFCAIAWVTMLAVFEVAAYKRRAYLLPALPLEALLAGWLLDRRLAASGEPSFLAAPHLVARGLARATLVSALAAGGGLLAVSLLGRSPLALAGLSPLDAALALGGIAMSAASLGAFVLALRAGDRWRALAATFVALGSVYVTIYPAGLAVLANQVSAKSLVTRIDHALPDDQSLRVCDVGEDRSLVLLLYFRDPARVTLIRDEPICRKHPPAGFYLLSANEWQRVLRRQESPADEDLRWYELFAGELKGQSPRSAVVFAERRIGDIP